MCRVPTAEDPASIVPLYNPRKAAVVSWTLSCVLRVGARCCTDSRCRTDSEDFLRLPPLPEGSPGLGAEHRVSLAVVS